MAAQAEEELRERERLKAQLVAVMTAHEADRAALAASEVNLAAAQVTAVRLPAALGEASALRTEVERLTAECNESRGHVERLAALLVSEGAVAAAQSEASARALEGLQSQLTAAHKAREEVSAALAASAAELAALREGAREHAATAAPSAAAGDRKTLPASPRYGFGGAKPGTAASKPSPDEVAALTARLAAAEAARAEAEAERDALVEMMLAKASEGREQGEHV
jgi:hypothetical protein